MGFMFKHGWKLIVLIVLAGIIFIWLIKAPVMSSYISNKMKVPVSINAVSMWPDQTVLRGFKIDNPSGFKMREALKAKRIQIDYNWKRLVGNPSVINQITMENVYLGVDCSNPTCSSNNWTAIGAGMPKEGKRSHEVLIHRLVLNDFTVEIRGLGLLGSPTTKHFDRMEFNEIDSKTGFPTKELVNKIFKGAGLQQYIQDAFSLPQNAIDQFLNPIRGLGGENEPPASIQD